MKVFCPAHCDANHAQIWGAGPYKDDSAICKAGIHAGQISDQGGALEVYLTDGAASYAPEKSHNIESNFSEASERAFEVKKLKQVCPS